uniref:N-acyl-aromatic-L-amino acid amidohydrolase n=1 Tax=Poecilia formosa TaxID=48698 RepID=A0A087X744_POEFO
MERTSVPPIHNVAICGGTHGNELTGVYIVREMQKQKMEKAGSVSVTTVETNPRAVAAGRRYTEMDLNRCFTDVLLSSPITESTPYEVRRAQELNAQLGPKGSAEAVDLLIDLHNTTSNMGLCLILRPNRNEVILSVIHKILYFKNNLSSVPVRAIQLDIPSSKAYSLESVGKHGFAIEVGPQPNGVLRADIFNVVKEALDLTLQWLQKFSSGHSFEGGTVEAYTFVKSVDYPRDSAGKATAVIHQNLQDNDFKLLRSGDPIFQTFSGDILKYEGEDLYPFFVNECAYYEKKIAFHLAQRKTYSFPPISVKND